MKKFKYYYYDLTWNFFTGCDPVSEACQNCVARKKIEKVILNKPENYKKYANHFEFTIHQEAKIKRYTDSQVVLVNSLSDTFHEQAPFDLIYQKFIQMIEDELNTYIICTKRPERMEEFVDQYFGNSLLDAENIILAVSIELAKYLDRLDVLRRIPAQRAVFFEPLLEDIGSERINLDGISRVYAGPEIMPFKHYYLTWYQHLEYQCDVKYIPFILTRPFERQGKWHGGDHRKLKDADQ